ncbi:MAG: sulfite exporter TauE/SafE family protein [Steroidobacteraceae bacterium]
MLLSAPQYLIGTAAGALAGFSLGLVGGGGSLLTVPLIVYAVGVSDAHVAVGTSALAVAANALTSLTGHARAGTVRWRIAGVFAAAGVAGAWLGSLAGKSIGGERLLFAFGVLMLVVGALMIRNRNASGNPGAGIDGPGTARLIIIGALTGALSGFFGIGGGFLIVPGLMYCAGLPILQAVGSSLVAVSAFGLTTAVSYARSGWIDWPLAAVFIGGGIPGGFAGVRLARRLAAARGALNLVFAGLVLLVALYIIYRGAA